MAKKIVNETTLLLKDVQNADKELKNIEKDYEAAKRILAERSTWVSVINELENLLPDKTWLTSMKGTSNSSSAPTAAAQPDQGGGGLFGFMAPPTAGQPKQARSAPSEIHYILVEGHSLVMKGSAALEEQFKENLKTSPLFSNNIEEIKTLNFETAKGDRNITTFKMEIKLAKPIKK